MKPGAYFILLGACLTQPWISVAMADECPVPPPCRCSWDDYSIHSNVTYHTVQCSGLIALDLPLLDTIVLGDFFEANYSNNAITEIPIDYFHPIRDRLQILDLSSNQIHTFPQGVTDLPQLRILYLGRNSMDFQSIINWRRKGLVALEYLDVSRNGIKLLTQDTFSDLSNLRHLDLRMNVISSIASQTFHSLSNLKELHLDGNHLTHIAYQMFSGLTSLEKLTISYNLVDRVLRGTFVNLNSVTSLDLSTNPIFKLESGSLEGLDSLQKLYLKFVPMAAIPAGLLSHVPTLREFVVDFSRLQVLDPDALAGPEDSMELISIEHTEIKTLPRDIFTKFKNLRKLDLTGLPISRLPNLTGLTKLNRLSILGCNITKIYPCELSDQKELNMMLWGSTGINCDCDTKWLKAWHDAHDVAMQAAFLFRHSGPHVKEQTDWICGSPSGLAGKSFTELTVTEFVCPEGTEPRWCDSDANLSVPPGVANTHFVVQAELLGQVTVSVRWAIMGDFAMSLDHVRIHCIPTNPTDTAEIRTVPFTSEKTTIDGLSPSSRYNICVECIGMDQRVLLSNCSELTTGGPSPETPIAVYAVPAAVAVVVLASLGAVIYVFRKYRLRGVSRSGPQHTVSGGFGGMENISYDVNLDGIRFTSEGSGGTAEAQESTTDPELMPAGYEEAPPSMERRASDPDRRRDEAEEPVYDHLWPRPSPEDGSDVYLTVKHQPDAD